MRSCQDFIVRATLDLTSTGRVPFRASDVYPLVFTWNGPGKERTVRNHLYALCLILSDGTPVGTERVARGLFQLTDPSRARAALLSAAPEWSDLLPALPLASD